MSFSTNPLIVAIFYAHNTAPHYVYTRGRQKSKFRSVLKYLCGFLYNFKMPFHKKSKRLDFCWWSFPLFSLKSDRTFSQQCGMPTFKPSETKMLLVYPTRGPPWFLFNGAKFLKALSHLHFQRNFWTHISTSSFLKMSVKLASATSAMTLVVFWCEKFGFCKP